MRFFIIALICWSFEVLAEDITIIELHNKSIDQFLINSEKNNLDEPVDENIEETIVEAEVDLSKNTPLDLLNTSAKKIHSKKEFNYLKQYILTNENFDIDDNLVGAIITPDKDIVPNSENLEPAFIVFENYEKILQWNRSLRFGLAVCTLKDKFQNVL